MKPALVFDFDGTLVDSRHDLAWAVNAVLETAGKPALSVEAVTDAIGHGVVHLLKQCIPGEDAGTLREKYHPLFHDFYLERCTRQTVCYPGVIEFCKRHAGRPMAILTQKPRVFTMKILEALMIRQFFDPVLCADDLQMRKPHPEGILRILDKFQSSPQGTLMVGDSVMDILAGKGAGVRTCAALYGFRPRHELEQAAPDHTIENFADLEAILGTYHPS